MEDTVRQMIFKAENITCAGCAEDMEKVLQAHEGIISVSVNYVQETVLVRYDPLKLDRKEVFTLVRQLAYPISIISEK